MIDRCRDRRRRDRHIREVAIDDDTDSNSAHVVVATPILTALRAAKELDHLRQFSLVHTLVLDTIPGQETNTASVDAVGHPVDCDCSLFLTFV